MQNDQLMHETKRNGEKNPKQKALKIQFIVSSTRKTIDSATSAEVAPLAEVS